MKKTFITIILFLCCLVGKAQSFEGQVIYNTSFKSKMSNISNEMLNKMAGDTLRYYMKGGDYRSDCNGTFFIWQIYINSDNKLYNKFSNSATIFWDNGALQKDSILNVQINKNATEILGYKCDELIFNCKSGIQKYYFSSKFPIDAKLYAKQLYQNWYDYLKIAKAMPLKMMIDNSQENVTMTAISVTPMKLNDSLFVLPTGAQLAPSPY